MKVIKVLIVISLITISILYLTVPQGTIYTRRNSLTAAISKCCFRGFTIAGKWSVVIPSGNAGQNALIARHEALHRYYSTLSKSTKLSFEKDYNLLLNKRDKFTLYIEKEMSTGIDGISISVPFFDNRNDERFVYSAHFGKNYVRPSLRKYYKGFFDYYKN